MPEESCKYLPWLILREIPWLGNIQIKTLIRRFRSPEAVLAASETQLATVDSLTRRAVQGILKHHRFEDEARRELDEIFRHDIKLVVLTDDLYPPLLRQIQDPPPVLTFYGTLETQSPCLSVIGSRNATEYGRRTAETLACRLCRKGFQIVSGLARGIDTMAHKGALRAGGRTIAVLGSGLKKIYPRENERLFHDIAETGTVFSEFKVNADPLPRHFPIRNRIIAGLSCGSIVVEAAERSGSLITARLTAEYGREVFAVPGSIQSRNSRGTHSLLKQGAKLAATETDILEELNQFIHEKNLNVPEPQSHHARKEDADALKKKYPVLNFLEPYPVHIDALIETTGMDSSTITSQLLDLELEGIVHRHPGNCYSISEVHH